MCPTQNNDSDSDSDSDDGNNIFYNTSELSPGYSRENFLEVHPEYTNICSEEAFNIVDKRNIFTELICHELNNMIDEILGTYDKEHIQLAVTEINNIPEQFHQSMCGQLEIDLQYIQTMFNEVQTKRMTNLHYEPNFNQNFNQNFNPLDVHEI
jgi:hypothetical protein